LIQIHVSDFLLLIFLLLITMLQIICQNEIAVNLAHFVARKLKYWHIIFFEQSFSDDIKYSCTFAQK